MKEFKKPNIKEEHKLEDEEIETIKAVLKEYWALDPQVVEDIISDVKEKMKNGYSSQEILDRINTLIDKVKDLTEMSDDTSDKTYKIKPAYKKEYGDAEKESTKLMIDELIKRLEKI